MTTNLDRGGGLENSNLQPGSVGGTGTPSSPSSGLTAEQVRDTVAAFIQQGNGITVTHDDGANTLTIASTVVNTDTQLTAEQVQDIVAAFLQQGSNVTITYDDAGNTLTIAASGLGGVSLTDDAVLDLAKTSRDSTDRGKFLGTSESDENALALLDDPLLEDGEFIESTVGPAVTSPSLSSWTSYQLTEALEPNAEYGFVCTHDTADTRFTRTTRLLGSDLIGLTAQTNASYTSNDGDPNVRTVLVPRLVTTGAFQIHIGMQNEAANQLYVNLRDAAYQIVRMVKYVPRGPRGVKGDKGDDGDLTAVSSDATLTGDGTSSDPLKVANPFTAADETKLDGIEAGATADQSGAEVKALLEALTGTGRLAVAAVNGALDIETMQDNMGGPAGDGSNGFLRSGSGIGIVYDDSAGTLTISATGGTAAHPDAYIAWSTDTPFSAAEFQAGTSVSSAREGAIPAQSGFAYLGLWLEGDHWAGITQVSIDHGPNGLSDLEAAQNLTIDGTAGKYRRYTTRLSGDVAGGGTLRWQ